MKAAIQFGPIEGVTRSHPLNRVLPPTDGGTSSHPLNKARFLFFALLFLSGMAGCTWPQSRTIQEQEVAAAWADMTLHITRYTPANSPTFASRGLGYIGLTMYESIVHGYPEYQSVAYQLNGLGTLPQPQAGVPYHWVLALNAGQAHILKNIYHQTSDATKQRIDSLETAFYQYFSKNAEKETI